MTETITTFVAVASAIIFSIFILFLPALWELIKPEDSGPRVIKDNSMVNLPKDYIAIKKVNNQPQLI